jgi:erythromycin esterase-like protein
MVPFVEFLRRKKIEFFGLDLYSLFESIQVIREASTKMDPDLARRILDRYDCFSPFDHDEIAYAKSLFDTPSGCQQEVLMNLTELLDSRLIRMGLSSPELFDIRQNARIIQGAEAYYRAMLEGGSEAWNLRDRHMLETLELLLRKKGPQSKAIIWAHNTHIGDYRATDMKEGGYVNLGGLARETFGSENVCLVGFGTYQGQVLAGRAWGSPEEKMPLPPAAENSIEGHLHRHAQQSGQSRFSMVFDEASQRGPLKPRIGHRAIGVVYNALFESRGRNLVPTAFTERYDAFFFVDQTHALKSFHLTPAKGLLPETWPQGL